MKHIKYRAFDYKHKGTNHLYNQDFDSIRSMGDGSIIAAIADGCSSEILSGVGGYFLCDAITDCLCEKFNPLFSENLTNIPGKSDLCSFTGEEIKRVIDTIISNKLNYLCDGFRHGVLRSYPDLDALEVPAHLFACTLIVVIALSNGTTYIYHIGDGVVLGRRKDNLKVDVLSEANNMGSQCRTYFASDYDFAKNAVFSEYNGGCYSDYFLTTDGWDKALTDGDDTTSNLKLLLSSLSEYRCSFREEFCNVLEETRESLKKAASSRVEDDMSCIWITEAHDNVLLNKTGDVSAVIKTKASGQYDVKSVKFGKTKMVVKLKKIKEKKPKPLPLTFSFRSKEKEKWNSKSQTPSKNRRGTAKTNHTEKTILTGKKETG